MAYTPIYTNTYPNPNGMYPNLGQQNPDQQAQLQQLPSVYPLYANPVLTVTNPTNYYQPPLYPTSQSMQTNYQYPAPSQVAPNLYPPSIVAQYPTQPNYTYTYPTSYYPAPFPAPLSTQAPQPSTTTQQPPLYPSSTSIQTQLYPTLDSSPKIEIPSDLPFDQTVQKSEELILAQLKSQESTFQSNINWYSYETPLRETVANEILKKFAAQYREKFNETGVIDLNQIKSNSNILKGLMTANEKFYSLLNLNTLFLKEIFELGNESNPFETVRKKINEGENPKSEKKPFSFLTLFKNKKVEEKEAATLKNKKLEAINLAEKEWTALNLVYTVDISKTTPSAPFITPPLAPIYPQISTESIATPPTTLPPYGAPIENPQPPAQQPAPIQPAQPTAGKKHSVKDNVPSWIDLAFANVTWNNLPERIKRLALLHALYCPGILGQAEKVALDIYGDLGSISKKLKMMTPSIPLSKDEFSIAGQKLLDLYYSDKSGVLGEFMEGFAALPKTDRFYQYVYEMAKAANVHIGDWDHDFAKYNWNKSEFFHLSIQALERCLYTSPKG